MSIPLSLYIHFPWCIKKCPYCDFNSHPLRGQLPEKSYVDALITDLEQELPAIWGRRIISIFMGGGTPSLFSADIIDYLMKQLSARLLFSPDIEITMEANPSTIEQQKFKSFREIGINRLSLGVQSFQEKKLQALGRVHSGNEAKQGVIIAKQAGFKNLNIDLMFGLPDQSTSDSLLDLTTALSLQPTHLSWYQLTIEPNTYFYRFPPEIPEDDAIWEMQQQGQKLLLSKKYLQYEISAYCLQDFQCLHNKNYWEYGDYLGIGAGAHSKLTLSQNGTIVRKSKTKHPKHYLSGEKLTAWEKIIIDEEKPLEFFMNTLRLFKPIPINLFRERTGLDINFIQQKINKAIDQGFMNQTNTELITTDLGKCFLNDLLQLFAENL